MTNNNMPKKKKNKTITIILVAILLCVIALNVSLFTRNKSSQENTYSSSDLSENYENNTTADTEKESNSKESVSVEGYVIATKLDTNYVLDIVGADTADGANLQLWERNGQYAQLFELRKNDNGYYQIININSGKALAAENGGTAEHTNVCQESIGASNSQYWKLVDAGNGYYYIIEKKSVIICFKILINIKPSGSLIINRTITFYHTFAFCIFITITC